MYRARLEAIAADEQGQSQDVIELHGGQLIERRSVPQWIHGGVTGRVYSFRDITLEVQAQTACGWRPGCSSPAPIPSSLPMTSTV